MPVVDPSHAEQGSTVRIPFLTLLAGTPVVPISPFAVEVYQGQDETGTLVVSLSPVVDDVGRFHVDWPVGNAQAVGIYAAYVNAEVAVATFFVDRIRFEVKGFGTYTTVAGQAVGFPTTPGQISAARNIEIFVQLVRTILRDHPQLNRLTEGRETSDGEIRIAMVMAMSLYNATPPPIAKVEFGSFPSIGMLVIGTIGWILASSGLLRLRNNLQYTDAGVTVDPENAALYLQAQNVWQGAYTQWVKEFKMAKNVSDAFGSTPTGLNSEYFFLSEFLGGSGVIGGVG